MKQNDFEKLYSKDYFLNMVEGHMEYTIGKISKKFKTIISISDLTGKKNILDIGCGRGDLSFYLASKNFNCVGIDLSDAAIRLFKENKQYKKYKNYLEVKKMDCTQLDFEGNTFDLIFMSDIVEHLSKEDLIKSLNEANRVLMVNGQLIIHTSPNSFLTQPLFFISNIFGIKWISQQYHINELNFFSLRKYLQIFTNSEYYIILKKQKNYFSNQVDKNIPLFRYIAKFLDLLFDNVIIDYLVRKTFLIYFLNTDLYAVINKYKI
ncbi:MAG: methyltransferase domain-containing protein [Thermotogota bacterium]|nr:methyltransferase domain-containing protein [Thermotogota bacterium]